MKIGAARDFAVGFFDRSKVLQLLLTVFVRLSFERLLSADQLRTNGYSEHFDRSVVTALCGQTRNLRPAHEKSRPACSAAHGLLNYFTELAGPAFRSDV